MDAPAPNSAPRLSLGAITAQYDRVARFYRPLEPLFLITPLARRKAVAALDLRPGDVVLEIGAGTGRNLPYLTAGVGETGRVLAVDASQGMLREARRLVDRNGWRNVELIEQDASRLELDRDIDAVLFSLSYSVIPDPKRALDRAWERLHVDGRLAVMDAGLTETPLQPVLDPIARQLIKLGPGNPYSRPWEDLAPYGKVTIERFMLGIYYVCRVVKEGNDGPDAAASA
jgi:ubiquinone/menaquinone biosynthesis C-methylase UbiE